MAGGFISLGRETPLVLRFVPNFYAKTVPQTLAELDSTPKGIGADEAAKRLQQYGLNELTRARRASALEIFFGQFKNVLILLLLAAAGVSFWIGDALEAGAMLVVVFLSAILGFIQEYRAERAIEALEKISAPTARVIRDGVEQRIPARVVVPGDVLLLEAGDIVPADARLLEQSSLAADESSLTGESVPSEKDLELYLDGTPVLDQENMVFSGSVITYGKGRAAVTATGMKTEIGQIAKTIEETRETQTPLQRKFDEMAHQITLIFGALTLLVFILGILVQHRPWTEMFIFAVSLAVAAIPESLPAIVTVSLGLGVRELARRRMIIKRLPAAESLGAVTVICSDKTGTMTKNEMTLTQLYADGHLIDVSGSGYEPKGSFSFNGKPFPSLELEFPLRAAVLCNNATLVENEEGRWEITGDPTEAALIAAARKASVEKDALTSRFTFVEELPFDSERKRMSVIYKDNREGVREAYVKGAPELLLRQCSHIHEHSKTRALTESDRKRILAAYDDMASRALRVLALAYRPLPAALKPSVESVEKELVFLGLAGMIDPPRPEVIEAIRKCHTAGIRVIMITGDHALTAKAVAQKIGLLEKGDEVLTGEDLDKLSDAQLEARIERIRVIARALPIQKTRIVDALQRRGHIVAMTGDGVNDAPALKKADVGIAMGITGTDVTKEVAKGILTDDNFATIVNAIEEGRTIFDKILKSTRYLLACNSGEVVLVLAAVLIGLPLPMLPLQILLMNLLTDGFPALGLGLEKSESDVMRRPPRHPSEKPLSNQSLALIGSYGVFLGLVSLAVFVNELPSGLAVAQTAAFTTLVVGEMFAVLASRSLKTFTNLNPLTNIWLTAAIALSLVLQLAVIYWPPLQAVFGTAPLTLEQWVLPLGVSVLVFLAMEAAKHLSRFVSNQNRDPRT